MTLIYIKLKIIKMKPVKNILAIVILLGISFVGCSKDEEIVKIAAGEIPDLAFRDYLLVNFDTDMDGFISTKEAKVVKEIDLSGKVIATMKGIEYFTSLEKLNMMGCYRGSELDLSKNEMLEALNCSENGNLQTLVLPDSKRLKILYCSNTQLTSVNLSGFESLEYFEYIGSMGFSIGTLAIVNSSIQSILCLGVQNLNIGHLPKLESMYLKSDDNSGRSHTVDLTNSKLLKTLSCDYIRCEMDINQCTALEELFWSYGVNKTIDLSKNTALKNLNLVGFDNVDFDISNKPALEKLRLRGGFYSKLTSIENTPALKELALYNIGGDMLDLDNHTNLEYLHIERGPDNVTNISNCKNLKDLFLDNGTINTIELKQFSKLKNVSLSCPNLYAINLSGSQHLDSLLIRNPKEGLEVDISNCSSLHYLYLDNKALLSKLNASGCVSLERFEHQPQNYNPSNWNLTKLDMSNCTSLQSLSCSYNQLTSLDVSGCTALHTISCDNNQLAFIDISGCTALNSLSCDDNQLTSLEISDCLALISLSCADNHIENLNVGRCSSLKILICNNNQLTSLNVSGLASLTTLFCAYNKIVELNVSDCVALNSIYCVNNNLKLLDVHTCLVLKDLTCYGNSDLETLILERKNQTEIRKDEHTQIVLVD